MNPSSLLDSFSGLNNTSLTNNLPNIPTPSNLNNLTNISNINNASSIQPIPSQFLSQSLQENTQSLVPEEVPVPRHRRTKGSEDERAYICAQCGKSYLSYPALYTHNKLKHNNSSSNLKGRGRPKKEMNESEKEKIRYNPMNFTYFEKGGRKGCTEVEELENICRKAFDEIYLNKRTVIEKGIRNYDKFEDHNFLRAFLESDHDPNKKLENSKAPADQVLIEYLNKSRTHVVPSFFLQLLKFVLLFREHANKIKREKESDADFTESHEAEDVPDGSNEFIVEFLVPEQKNEQRGEGINFGFGKEEAIDLTQNLCQWMYENNFTASKLTLIRNEEENEGAD